MSKKAANVPILNLEKEAFPGLHIRRFHAENHHTPLKTLHRDNYFIFLFQQTGKSSFLIDFNLFELVASCVCSIIPGSVHQVISQENSTGWLLAVENDLIDETIRGILIEAGSGAISSLENRPAIQLGNLAETIQQQLHLKNSLNQKIVYHLVSAFAGLIASATVPAQSAYHEKREIKMTSEFKKLLSRNFREHKSPSWYASKLGFSMSYLNECIKAVTGEPPSIWIQKEVILESKRLLAYTSLSTKEIAYDLGYEDPAYFNRLFFKITNMRPAAFRNIYRE